ncbi:MAG: AAA family ATPase, partial [Chloroflexi bacterium]|nr:AAA family ATPase [Chloroflexota bacterium]
MYLKRLDLVGFKSFAGSTTFAFEPGISVLCGPNGSGKSNVADAVRWALGEQSVRAIRGRRGEDVIFVGSQDRQPLGLSEVSLTLDNADGRIPLDYDEVRITRRLYRSGDAEYLVNGSRVRLKDIHEWLLHAALDPDAYVVVGQGSVDALILQRAEERRTVLENAADIRRHHVKLTETRSRLAETEENLLRCRAVIAELEPHVARLRSQAERAGRYRACRDELSGLASGWFRQALGRGRADVEQATAAAAAVRVEVERLEAVAADLEGAARAADGRAMVAEEELGRWEPMLADARADQARLVAEAAVAEERRRAAVGSAATLLGEMAELGQRSATLEAEVAGLREEIALGRAELEQVETAVEFAGPADQDAQQVREAERELTALRGRLAELSAAVQAGRAALQDAHARRERAEQHRERLAAELARLEPELAAARREASSHHVDAEQCGVEVTALRERSDALGTSRAGAQRALSDLRAERQRLIGEQERIRVKQEATEAEATSHSGSGAGVLLEGRLAGTRGLVGGELRVPAELQSAVSAALGGSAHTVVVEDSKAALAGVQLLQERRAERASIAPLRGAMEAPLEGLAHRFKSLARPLLADLSLHGFADELVASDPELDGLRARYLALSVVVPTLDLAREVACRLSRGETAHLPWQVVTSDGQAVRWNGEWRGGHDRAVERLVARRRELAMLDASLGELAGAIIDVNARLAAVEERCAMLDVEEGDIDRLSRGAEAAEREAVAAFQQAEARVARSRRDLEAARAAVPDAQADAARCVRAAREHACRLEAAELGLSEASAAVPVAEARATELRAGLE